MYNKRRSGILLHITSLPGRWGMGELGPQARGFARFLVSAGQTLWQILPAGPVGCGFSPYSSLSSFAGNHLLISFDELIGEGLLTREQLAGFPDFNRNQIDFPSVAAAREKILFNVAGRFRPDAEFEAFRDSEFGWLADYSLFMAIRESQGNRSWTKWPEGLRDRDPGCLAQARKELAVQIRRHEVLQYLFARHWEKTALAARELGISTIGDLPIFVADDSADVWSNRSLFFLNADGTPSVAAGVPPDYFSETGQRWGNPLYNWSEHRRTGYDWWTKRMRRSLEMTDIVRIDHFRGFSACWEIPAEEPTAIRGRWVKGPGIGFFRALQKNLRRELSKQRPGGRPPFRLADHVIAENLGIITEDVEALRTACGFPGMLVLQFRFGAKDMRSPGFVPEGKEADQTVYTGTHDNDTVCAWFNRLPKILPDQSAGEFDFERKRILDYLGTDGREIHRDFIRLAMRSPARMALIPMQDVLGLGSGARMNTPGTVGNNWRWRLPEDSMTEDTARWLLEAAQTYNRTGGLPDNASFCGNGFNLNR